jgi:hypothetical protein
VKNGMIAFTCKQCRKRHSRADSQAGTLVFCECGQGNRVPWSTGTTNDIPDAVPVAGPMPSQPARPRASPMPAAVPASRPVPSEERRPEPSLPFRKPDRPLRKISPNFCLQHDEDPSEVNCDACKLPFCKRCVVSIQGQTLCGPCKNFRIAGLGRPPRILPLAVYALVISLVSGPVTLILSLVAMGLHISEGATAAAVVLCLLGSSLPITGLILAGLALRQIETRPQVGGRALATSGACIALVGVLWCVTVIGVVVVKYSLG